MMNLQITLTQCELLFLLPEVRSQVREATSNRQVPWVSTQTAPTDQNFVDAIASIELEDEEGDQAQHDVTQLDTMLAAYQSAVYSSMLDKQNHVYSNDELLPGSTIINNPYEVYLSTAPVS